MPPRSRPVMRTNSEFVLRAAGMGRGAAGSAVAVGNNPGSACVVDGLKRGVGRWDVRGAAGRAAAAGCATGDANTAGVVKSISTAGCACNASGVITGSDCGAANGSVCTTLIGARSTRGCCIAPPICTARPPSTTNSGGAFCSIASSLSSPVATMDTRMRPSKDGSIAEPNRMSASASTSLPMRLAACSTSIRVRSSPPEMLISRPRAPCMDPDSSSGLLIAASAARNARSSPSASPVPIIALPFWIITVRTSAKSRLIRPLVIIKSVMPRTPM